MLRWKKKAAESDADFISKCSIGLKELRESSGRVRVCVECGFGPAKDATWLAAESNELISIVTTIIKNKRSHIAARTKTRRRRETERGYTFTVPDARPKRSDDGAHS